MTVQDRLRQAGQHIEAEEFDQAESLCADVLKSMACELFVIAIDIPSIKSYVFGTGPLN